MTSGESLHRALEDRLGVEFRDPDLLQRAFIHASVLNENPAGGDLESNERLEFLGDAVLGHVVAAWLYDTMPDASEGELTRARSALVSRETLASVAKSIGLNEVLELGRGEEANAGRIRGANLADALEALIGALYLDGGEQRVASVVRRLLEPRLSEASRARRSADPKTRLQEIVQDRHKRLPSYVMVSERGPAHAKEFTVEVRVEGQVVGTGRGPNKRTAEQAAATVALAGLAPAEEPDDADRYGR